MTKNKDSDISKNKKPRQKLSRVLANNLFLLKIMHRAAPWYIPVFIVISVAFAALDFLSNAYMLRYVINGIQEGRDFGSLLTSIVVIFSAMIAVVALNSFISNILQPYALNRATHEMLRALYKHARSVELACFENPEFYDKYVKAADAGEERISKIMDSLGQIIYTIVTLSANVFLILLIDPVFILFALVTLFGGFANKKFNKLKYEREQKRKEINRRKSYSRRVFYLNEFAKEMRLSNMFGVMKRKYKDAVDDYIAHSKKTGAAIVGFGLISELLREIVTIGGATVYALYQTVITGNILMGDCVVIISSISRISWTLQYSITNFLEFYEHSLYIENLREFLAYEPKIVSPKDPLRISGGAASRGRLELRNVSFRYDSGKVDVLKNISIYVNRGEKVVLVGHNGAGKTTLVKLLLRLYDPTAGTVFLDGCDIREYDLDEYRRAFSVVFQDLKPFALSAAENMLLRPYRENDAEPVVEALKQSGAYNKIASLKNGVNTSLTCEFDNEGAVLSGGEFQMLSLGRIFVENSDFILLDEPSSALDPINEYKMYENMIRACEGRGVIFISHRLSSAVLADRIYLLENGEVIETGTHRELMEKCGVYADMFKKQASNYVGVNYER